MLKLWGYKQSALCPLCDRSPCTIHHILSNCQYALNQRRYNWRHDSVLKNIELALVPHIRSHNASSKPKTSTSALPLNQFFVRKNSRHKPKRPKSERSSLLDGANDWEVLVDFDTANIVFPPSICATASRPDIVIWSPLSRKVTIRTYLPGRTSHRGCRPAEGNQIRRPSGCYQGMGRMQVLYDRGWCSRTCWATCPQGSNSDRTHSDCCKGPLSKALRGSGPSLVCHIPRS